MVSPPSLASPEVSQCHVGDDCSDEDFDCDEKFDDHGFALPPQGDSVGDSSRDYARWFEPKALRRLGRFELRRKRLADPGAGSAMPKKALKAMLRKGVPAEHRKEVWWSVLGCEARRKQAPRSYAQHLDQARQGVAVKTAEEIERDLQRTFPNHRKFRAASGQAELRNVLSAFAHHSPRVQYCQGLNFIAALLLTVLKEEELAFWALVSAIETLGVERYYTEGMTLLRADMRAMGALLERKCPKVARTFSSMGVDLMSVCSEWFITWFAKSLPVSTTLRVWDTLFFEGFKVLFRVAIGVFKLVEPEILRCTSFEDVMEQAKAWPRHMVKHNELLKASFNGVPGFRRTDLLQVRDDALCRVEREDEEQRRRQIETRERFARDKVARQAAAMADVKQQPAAAAATPAALPAGGAASLSAAPPLPDGTT